MRPDVNSGRYVMQSSITMLLGMRNGFGFILLIQSQIVVDDFVHMIVVVVLIAQDDVVAYEKQAEVDLEFEHRLVE
uniref:Uncharacterized protein n=1 Tax=Candidozyma auris TaxID=498019 RepID=A0A0L0NN63_CANAR